MDAELDRFKSRIDLREYAASLGYELDRRESSRSSSVMRHAGDKVVIKRNANGHYIYFSVRDDADNGTIIDFVQNRQDLNIGQLRKELRLWIGRPDAVPGSQGLALPLLETSSRDRLAVERSYSAMTIANRHPYLEQERNLSAALLSAARFAGRIRIDTHGNAVFPHFNGCGLCGYELKNRNFTGFAKGGEKGLWESHDQADDVALVFAESAIDALSHATLFPQTHARYRSSGGALNADQPDLIIAAIATMPVDAAIICATDNDATGRELAAAMEGCFQSVGRSDLRFLLNIPTNAEKDWNQVLQTIAGSSPPSFPIALS